MMAGSPFQRRRVIRDHVHGATLLQFDIGASRIEAELPPHGRPPHGRLGAHAVQKLAFDLARRLERP